MPSSARASKEVEHNLSTVGYAHLGRLLSDRDAASLKSMYQEPERFRSRIVMQRHGFGLGEYQYFDRPLPRIVADLRRDLYRSLAPIANRWQHALGETTCFPRSHRAFVDVCGRAGQTRPTPLILKYGAGDYNCLHQDLYGDVAFPIQVVVLLSNEGDFGGGEFVFTEQRPRRQSRATVIPLRRGHGVAFAVNTRPEKGQRGYYRVKHRHGVSTLHSGERYTLGLIFHDAA